MRRGAITAKTIGFFGVVLFLAVLGAWLNAKGLLLSPAEKPNLIFISLHDIRADHLGAYGYSRDTSPNIDAFSQDGILFENAFQQGARSSMSFASLFTSQYPRANGVVFVDQVLSSSATTLTEILGEEGYETGAFVQSSQLLAKYGITKDFGVLRQSGNSEDLLMFASSWLAENNDQPKFLFLEMSVESTFQPPVAFENHYDPEYAGLLSDHTEYYLSLAVRERPNAILPALKAINGQAVLQAEGGNIVLNERDLEHLVAHYDDGVRYADFVFGEMVEMLKKSGVYDNSVIVLFANHGETLTDHLPRDQMRNIQLTGFAQVYDEIIHSPLIVRGLGLKPGRVSSQVQLIDIFPTVLDILRIRQGAVLSRKVQGRTLVPVMEGTGKPEAYAYGQTEAVQDIMYVRSERWKLMAWPNGNFVLYDLQKDPGETTNVADQHSGIVEQLKEKLRVWQIENVQLRLEGK